MIENSVSNAVLADLDGDGLKEILFAAYDGKVHAYWLDRTEKGNWPYRVPGTGIRFAGEPVVADLDNDGRLDVVCATENVLTLKRSTGKSLWQDATSQLTSLEDDIDADGTVETVALFAEGFEDFFWQYDNNGLRHAQLRFYPMFQ